MLSLPGIQFKAKGAWAYEYPAALGKLRWCNLSSLTMELFGVTFNSCTPVTETPLFQRLVVAVWTDEERNEFIGWLSSNPLAGDVVPAAGGLRKVRWSRAGMGKRGGARVIYFKCLTSGDMVLL